MYLKGISKKSKKIMLNYQDIVLKIRKKSFYQKMLLIIL